jgi:hypothetical protein
MTRRTLLAALAAFTVTVYATFSAKPAPRKGPGVFVHIVRNEIGQALTAKLAFLVGFDQVEYTAMIESPTEPTRTARFTPEQTTEDTQAGAASIEVTRIALRIREIMLNEPRPLTAAHAYVRELTGLDI